MSHTKTELAAMEGRTLFPKTRKGQGYTSRLLKASANDKVGQVFTWKPWAGAKIFTLTLEERATCPRDCQVWNICYGNNMPFAHRISLPHEELISRIEKETEENAKKYRKIVYRLHILGDFYSVDYVLFWSNLLAQYPNLYIWGYTANLPDSAIGQQIVRLNQSYPIADGFSRVLIRFSHNLEHSDGIYSAHTQENIPGSIVCPEQTGKVSSCGDCGLCMNPKVTKKIQFIKH